jgi:hypothetical protein
VAADEMWPQKAFAQLIRREHGWAHPSVALRQCLFIPSTFFHHIVIAFRFVFYFPRRRERERQKTNVNKHTDTQQQGSSSRL